MHRRAVVVFLLFAMLWQSVALARPGSTVNVLADVEHAALHWQAQAHHHHEDGSYHLDDSHTATLHVHGDPMTASAALLPAMAQLFSPLGNGRPGGMPGARVPAPFLDGLLRPPRPAT